MNKLKEINLRDILADLVDAWNEHEADRVASFYAPEYIGAEAGEQHGPADIL